MQGDIVIEEQTGEDEEMKEAPPLPLKIKPSEPNPNTNAITKKEVPRTLLQAKSPKPAQAAPTTTNRSPRMVRIFDQPASQRERSTAINRRESGKPQAARMQEEAKTKHKTPPKQDGPHKAPSGKTPPKKE